MNHNLEEFYQFKKNPGEGLCRVKFCPGDKRWNSTLCHKHAQRWFRFTNPLKAAFDSRRNQARRRGLIWEISFKDFKTLCKETSYLEGVGITRDCLQIDRIDGSKGYTIDNIQIITVSENVAKGNRERHLPEYIQSILKRRKPDCPF